MLKLENITWSVPGGEQILNGINLEIPEGKLTVITGPNGGGKTSLAKLSQVLKLPQQVKFILTARTLQN